MERAQVQRPGSRSVDARNSTYLVPAFQKSLSISLAGRCFLIFCLNIVIWLQSTLV